MYTDSIAKEDFLGRRAFSKKISQGIFESTKVSDEGFVVSLTGKWGSGKSTLLSFIHSELIESFKSEENKPHIIEFNPWIFTDAEDIKKSFLKKFLEEIQKENLLASTYKRSKKIYRTLQRAGILKDPSRQFLKDLKNLLEKYLDNTASSYLKKEIDKKLSLARTKVFVFIDDIDRLYPKQIFDILQVLKLTCNFKNTYYIIAFDREAVETAIESQFKNYGNKYLDKIIQADFLIPNATAEVIEQLFFRGVEQVIHNYIKNWSFSQLSSIWLHHGLKNFFLTPRDVYRYINSIELTLPHVIHDANIEDFLILETVRLYDFAGYTQLYEEYSKRLFPFESFKPINSEEVLINFTSNHTKRLIKYLFPNNKHLLDVNEPNSKRLRDPAFFERYFTLSISSKDIAEEEFKQIVENKVGRNEILKNIFIYGRLKNLCIRLNDSRLYQYYSNWDFSLISDLYYFFDENAVALEDSAHDLTDFKSPFSKQERKK